MGCCNGLSNFSTFQPPNYDFQKYAEVSLELKRILFIQKALSNNEIDYIPCILSDPLDMNYRPNFIVYFHGKEEDIFSSYGFSNALEIFVHMNIITVEYPGYSIYQVRKNVKENLDDIVLKDSLIVYDRIKKIFGLSNEHIFILGRGIGSAPATYLASKRNPGGLFLVSAITSIEDLINEHSFNLGGIFVKSSFETIKFIKDVKCPILLIHGLKDTIIPIEHSKKLFNEITHDIKEYSFRNDMEYIKYDAYKDVMTPIDLFLKKNKLIKNSGYREFDLNNIKEFNIPNKFNIYLK